MKRWMILFVCALVLGMSSLVLRLSSLDTWSTVLGYIALIVFIGSLIQLSLIARSNRSVAPSRRQGQKPAFRSKTQALHAAIFGSHTVEPDEIEE